MSGISFEKLVGLSQDEVVERQGRDGFNELPTQEKRTAAVILLEVLKEPMFLLLIGCGALYLLSGEFQEALMLLGFVFVIIAMRSPKKSTKWSNAAFSPARPIPSIPWKRP